MIKVAFYDAKEYDKPSFERYGEISCVKFNTLVPIKHDFTHAYVAAIIGISEATLKAYENGDRMLRFDIAYALARVYGVELGNCGKQKAKHID